MNTSTIGKTLALIIVSFMAAAQTTVAQDMKQTDQAQSIDQYGGDVTWELEFHQVDTNSDNAVEWPELNSAYSRQLNSAGWNKEDVFSKYDRNQDGVLDEPEYWLFITGLENAATAGEPHEQGQAARNQQGRQGQQQQQAVNQQGEQVIIIAVTTMQEVPVADIEDRPVINLQGQDIGEVEDVVVSQDQSETGLVVGVGGFWDIGDKDIFVDLDEVTIRADRVVWETMAGEEELKDLPEYNEEDYISMR